MDIHEAAGAFHIDQVHALRPEQARYRSRRCWLPLPELEVVNDREAVRQVVAQIGDRLALGVVDGLADGEDLGHQAAPLTFDPVLYEGARFAFPVYGVVTGGSGREGSAT